MRRWFSAVCFPALTCLRRHLLPLLLLGFGTACTVGRQHKAASVPASYCEPALVYHYDSQYRPLPALPTDTALTNHLSTHDLLMANALGLIPLLRRLAHRPAATDGATQLAQATLRQQLQGRLLLASTEIASLAAELDCEGERADQLAAVLDGADARRVRNLTLLSVVIGAVTTVATALIPAEVPDKLVGIGGGVLSAGLGGAAALSSNKTVAFRHDRNLLADIWYPRDTASTFAPFIWSVLNEKAFSNTGQQSIRTNIRQRWQQYVLTNASAAQQQLLFGPGGAYQADDLHTRANMLNQLQASVRSINQDLQSLLIQLTR